MSRWLQYLGYGGDAEELAGARLAVHHPIFLIIALALFIPIALWIVYRQRTHLHHAPARLRWVLDCCRIAVVAACIVILADPYLELDQNLIQKPMVSVLIDASDSMRLPVGGGPPEELVRHLAAGGRAKSDTEALSRVARLDHALAVLRTSEPAIERALGNRMEARYQFFDTLPHASVKSATALGDIDESGKPASNLGAAINHVIEHAGNRTVGGIVLISDGQNTGGDPPIEAARAAGVSILTVPAGCSRPPVDVAVSEVMGPGEIHVGDTARIVATIESAGLTGRPQRLVLREGATILDTRDITLRDSEPQRIELLYPAREPGEHVLTVESPPLGEESGRLAANNTDRILVKVTDTKLKVLYLEGKPRWDYRFLRNAMRRDRGLGGRLTDAPDVVLESERLRLPRAQRPALPAAIDELAAYHTIVLGDISPESLSEEFIRNLTGAVRDRGVGLIVAAGSGFMPYAYSGRLDELLPVRVSGPGHLTASGEELHTELSAEGSLAEACRLVEDVDKNRQLWRRLPAFHWCSAVERLTPGAAPLVWNANRRNARGKLPLMASQRVGKGEVIFVGTDSTWTWRENEGDRLFYRFWGQCIRTVARLEEDSPAIALAVEPKRIQPGQEVRIELRTRADESPPAVRIINDDNGQEAVLQLARASDGRYQSLFSAAAPGSYRIAYATKAAAHPIECRFLCASEELRRTEINRPLLEAMARASGGRMVELPDMADAIGALKAPAISHHRHEETRLWDGWTVLLVLAGIYLLDIALRRLGGLS